MTNASQTATTELVTKLSTGDTKLSVLMHEGELYVPLSDLYVPLGDLGTGRFVAALSGKQVRVTTIPAVHSPIVAMSGVSAHVVSTHVVSLADVLSLLDWLTTAAMGSVPRISALRDAINSWIHRAGRLVEAITKLTPTPNAPAQSGALKTVPLRVSISVEGGTPELNTALGNLLLRGLDAIPGTQTDTGDTGPSPTRH